MGTVGRILAITALVGWLPVLVAYGAIQALLRAPDWLAFLGACAAYFLTAFAGAIAAAKLNR